MPFCIEFAICKYGDILIKAHSRPPMRMTSWWKRVYRVNRLKSDSPIPTATAIYNIRGWAYIEHAHMFQYFDPTPKGLIALWTPGMKRSFGIFFSKERYRVCAYTYNIMKRLAYYAHIDGMKDPWCSGTSKLLSTDMKLWGEASLVRFGYQHRREWV